MKKLTMVGLILLVFSSLSFASEYVELNGITLGKEYTGSIPMTEQSKKDVEAMKDFEFINGCWYYKKNYKYEVQSNQVPKTIYYQNNDGSIKIEADVKTKLVKRIEAEYKSKQACKNSLLGLINKYHLHQVGNDLNYENSKSIVQAIIPRVPVNSSSNPPVIIVQLQDAAWEDIVENEVVM